MVLVLWCDALVLIVLSNESRQSKGRGLVDRKPDQAPPPPPPVILLLGVPMRSSVFGSLVILDVAFCYLRLFSLYINIKIG